jgi:hypothetical protein
MRRRNWKRSRKSKKRMKSLTQATTHNWKEKTKMMKSRWKKKI